MKILWVNGLFRHPVLNYHQTSVNPSGVDALKVQKNSLLTMSSSSVKTKSW